MVVGDFNGDGRTDLAVAYADSSNLSVVLGVPLATTATTLGSSANPSNPGQSVTLTATVTPSTATGTVTFYDGATSLGTGTLSAGSSTFATSALASGAHSLTAVYGGDGNNTASTSSALPQNVNTAATVTLAGLTATYTGTAKTVTATTNPPGLTVSITYHGVSTAPSAAGSYPIVAAVTSVGYTGSATGTLLINQAVLTVTAQNASMAYGGTLPALTYVITGFVNGDNSNVVTGSPSLTTTATSASPAGAYPITAALGTLSAANYTFSFVAGTLTVTRTPGNVNVNSDDTLRAAIANALSGDRIAFTANITLLSPLPPVQANVSFASPGFWLDGAGSFQVLHVTSGATVFINGLTIQNGANSNGGGIQNDGMLTVNNGSLSGNSSSGNGGGILNNGILTVNNSTLSDNIASYAGNGIYNASGGTLTVTNSTLFGNGSPRAGTPACKAGSVCQYGGGGIFNAGMLTVTNSTFSGNYSNADGAGIYNDSGATLWLTNSTLFSNSVTNAPRCAAGNTCLTPGGIFNDPAGNATLKSTILAMNSPANCSTEGATVASQGYNLSDDASCSGGFISSDLNNPSGGAGLDPNGLQNNGGFTQTIALLATSPALDAIPVRSCTDVTGQPVTTDQRGIRRPQGPACDIGAVEAMPFLVAQTISFTQAPPPNASITYNGSFTVAAQSTSGLAVALSVDAASTGVCSLGTQTTVSPVTNAPVTMLSGTGTCTIDANQAGNGNYSAAAQQQISVTASPATATVTLGNLSATYSGSPISATATTIPSSLRVILTYNGSSTAPTAAGSYTVVGTINDSNYTGSASGTLVINALPVTLQSSPVGRLVSVDGGAAQATPFSVQLAAGTHTIAVAATQAGSPGTQYVFSSWSDAGAASHSITVSGPAATYTATFQTQYQLTTAASPSAGGTVTPSSGTFYNPGSVVSVQATANAGYRFANFSGALTGSGNPQNVTLNGPTNVVANFTPLTPNIAASVGTRTVAGSTVLVSLTLTNTGLGAATNATITGITAITLVSGSGTVTVASGTPVNLGTINPGASASTTVTFNWPSTAARVSFTVNFTADGGYSGSSRITTLY